jgi:predicted TIM-barrel fold metal-dependent hydrolase
MEESMERIGVIQFQVESVLQSSGNATLVKRSQTLLPDGMESALTQLFAQTLARYPNQELPPDTPDMYLEEWEKLALKFGLEAFTVGLSKAIDESDFFPDPHVIRYHCAAQRRADGERERTQKACAEMVAAREVWERQRRE